MNYQKALQKAQEIYPETCFNKKQVRAFVGGVAPSTINKWIVSRGFPKPIYVTKTFPLWRVKDILAWLDSLDQSKQHRSQVQQRDSLSL